MTHYTILLVPLTPVVNFPVSPSPIAHDDLFPANFVPADPMPACTREVGGTDFLLQALYEKMKYFEPLSDDKEVEECLF